MKLVNYEIKYVVDYFDEDNNFWQPWVSRMGFKCFMFNSRESAVKQLKEALDTKGTSDEYRFDFLFNTKYRTREIFRYQNEYTGECQPINI